MKKGIVIEVPKGYEVDEAKSTFTNIVFKEIKKEITERIKTPEDAIKELGECDEDVIQYRKLQEINIASHILNNQLAIIIVKALNEGWVADWSDSDQYKYYPWFEMGENNFRCCDDDSRFTSSSTSTRLCFLNKKDLLEAVEKFIDIYKESRIG